MKILLLSDIHANFQALKSITVMFPPDDFDYIINCGDSLVYGPSPNKTLKWLRKNKSISILGNTDRKIIKLNEGNDFKKPSNPEKRIMYDWTSQQLTAKNKRYLQTLEKEESFSLQLPSNKELNIGVFHGSPADPDEFLFPDTPEQRFQDLTLECKSDIIVFGHSHTPFHRTVGSKHFINPGSVGRMFDGNPKASCATIYISNSEIVVKHYRIPYDTGKVSSLLTKNNLPPIYGRMFTIGKKLN